MNEDITLLAFVRPALLKIVKAHIALKQYDKAVEEAQKHVNNEESVEGLHALGEAQLAAEMFDKAVQTHHRAMEIAPEDKKRFCQQKLEEAKVALKQSKEKNYYKILGVPRNAKLKEIKKSYRELALKVGMTCRMLGNLLSMTKSMSDVSSGILIRTRMILKRPRKCSRTSPRPTRCSRTRVRQSEQPCIIRSSLTYTIATCTTATELRGKYDRGEEVFENQGGGPQHHHMNPNMFFQQHFHHGGGGGGRGPRMHFRHG